MILARETIRPSWDKNGVWTDWTRSHAWEFIEAFPTPEALEKAGSRKWMRFLHTHRVWREDTAEKRLAIFGQATALQGCASAIAAKSFLAIALVSILKTLQAQLDVYRARIEERFQKHPDHDLFGSLPGAGPKLAPRLLGEIGDNRSRFDCAEGLQAYAGTAPVTFPSGQIEKYLVRRACATELRAAVHLWAGLSLKQCALLGHHLITAVKKQYSAGLAADDMLLNNANELGLHPHGSFGGIVVITFGLTGPFVCSDSI
jgi:hypothetical protein